jgi:hypothetical protein
VRTLFRLSCILPLFIVSAQAQKVLVAGARTTAECDYAVIPLVTDLKGIGFPNDWTVVVACTSTVWNYLQTKADARGTHTAFTNLLGRVTVINGAMYLESLPLAGTMHPTPRLVLEHEHGHILCECNDEREADRAAGIDLIGTRRKRSANCSSRARPSSLSSR